MARGKAFALAFGGRDLDAPEIGVGVVCEDTSSRPISSRPPCALILRAAASHIMPGPLRG